MNTARLIEKSFLISNQILYRSFSLRSISLRVILTETIFEQNLLNVEERHCINSIFLHLQHYSNVYVHSKFKTNFYKINSKSYHSLFYLNRVWQIARGTMVLEGTDTSLVAWTAGVIQGTLITEIRSALWVPEWSRRKPGKPCVAPKLNSHETQLQRSK